MLLFFYWNYRAQDGLCAILDVLVFFRLHGWDRSTGRTALGTGSFVLFVCLSMHD